MFNISVMRCLVYKKKFEIRTHGRFSFQKLHDDTKHLKQNGAGHSYGTTDMKTPLETSFGLDKSSVVSHSRNDVGRKGTDLNTAERPYQPGIIPLTIFRPIMTFVVCSSHMLIFLGSLYCKQYGVWSGYILFVSIKI